MKQWTRGVFGTAALLLALAALTGTSTPAPTGPSLVVNLHPQNRSGESGTATLTQQGPDLIVQLRMKNTGGRIQPAHIHKGTCAKLDPNPAYPLANVVNGRSTTRLRNVSLPDLVIHTYSINVHRSITQIAVYVSCGQILPTDKGTGGINGTGL